MNKNIVRNIEGSSYALKLREMATELLDSDENNALLVYKKFAKTRLILFICLIIPGLIYHFVKSGHVEKIIKEEYKGNILGVFNKYAEKHKGIQNQEVTHYAGTIDRAIRDDFFNIKKKKKSYNYRYDRNTIKTYREGWSLHGEEVADKYVIDGAQIIERFQSGAFDNEATALEYNSLSFDLYRFAGSASLKKGGDIDVNSVATRVYLKSDIEGKMTYRGLPINFCNYIPIVKFLQEFEREDSKGNKFKDYRIQQKDGVAGLMIGGNTGLKFKDSMVFSSDNLLVKPTGKYLFNKLYKDPFESTHFNKNHELALGKDYSEVELFKKFTPKIVDKFDVLTEEFPGWAISIKKNGDFTIMLGAYKRRDIPFSLDKPTKFVKNKEYAIELITSDMIYLHCVTELLNTLETVKLFKFEDELVVDPELAAKAKPEGLADLEDEKASSAKDQIEDIK